MGLVDAQRGDLRLREDQARFTAFPERRTVLVPLWLYR